MGKRAEKCFPEIKTRNEYVMDELHDRINVERKERLLLYPKLKMPPYKDQIQPSYYDIILTSNALEPELEEHFYF